MEEYIVKGGKKLRLGYTTGSCAAAAAKAAAYMLLTGHPMERVALATPKGIRLELEVKEISMGPDAVSCAIEKDSGDDPDVTRGTLVFAEVSRQEAPGVAIDGGIGVGRVTKPGLEQPVGAAAVNRVPRRMIRENVLEICRQFGYEGDLKVVLFVPEGEALAKKTFNPRLGILGGISILGTSGIVEPMSSQAILDTIRVELNQRRVQGFHYAAITPGNYGQEFMKRAYGYDLDRSVKCSNFIGETIDMAVELGFSKVLLTGHIGKLIKVAGGIMNTHSREADARMELLAAFAIKEGAEPEQCRRILECVTTEEAVAVLSEKGKVRPVMEYAAERICYYLEKRAGGNLQMDCVLYSNEYGELARSKGAEEWFILLAQDAERQI